MIGTREAAGFSPKTAVVLNGHTMSGLAITRSLGRKGIRVIVVSDVKLSMTRASRYCAEVIYVPSMFEGAQEAALIVGERMKSLEPSIVFAPNDTAVMFVHRFLNIFEGHICAVPDAETARWALDKARTVRLANRLGLPIPHTWFPEEYQTAAQLADVVTYPCVIKPRQGKYWKNENQLSSDGTIEFCRDRTALIEALSQPCAVRPIIQEFVQGEGRGVYLLMEHGESRMEFAHRRLRESNPKGSGASLAEAVPVDDVLGEISRTLLRETKWHGVAMVEFKVGDRPYIMEINGRFWNSLPLSLQAGCDFPWQLFLMYAGQRVATQHSYRVGTRCRFLYGDLVHLFHAMRGRPHDWPGAYPTRRGALLGFLRACLPDVGSYTFTRDDPLPGLLELWVNLASLTVR